MADRRARWQLSTGDLLGSGQALEVPLWWSDSPAVAVEHPELSVVVTAVRDRCLWAWDPVTGEQVGDRWEGHEEHVRTLAAAVLADGTPLVVSGALDGAVRRWDARTGREYGPPLRPLVGDAVEVATARLPDGRTAVCVATTVGMVFRFDAASGQPLAPPVDLGWSESRSWWPLRGSRLACLPTDTGPIVVTMFDVRDPVSGQVLNRIDTGRGIDAMAAAVLDDGTPVIVAADGGGYVRRFHALTGARIDEPVNPFLRPVTHVWAVPGPSGDVVLAAMLDGGLCRFDATTGERCS